MRELSMQHSGNHLSLITLAFAKARRALMRAEDLIWEYRLGISTGDPGGFEDSEHRGYATTPYRIIFMILNRLMLRPDDIFLDIGCGRGRVLCCAARYGVSQIIGIDDVIELAIAAQGNLLSLRKPHNFRHDIICAKAQNLDYRRITAIYMFNPFGASTTREVMGAIGESLVRKPHPVRIAYVNSRQESVLADTGWLECYDNWEPGRMPGHQPWTRTSFWRSIGHP